MYYLTFLESVKNITNVVEVQRYMCEGLRSISRVLLVREQGKVHRYWWLGKK